MSVKKSVVELSEEERVVCQEVVRKLTGTSQKVKRANILLKSDLGWTDDRIADAVNCRRQTVFWRTGRSLWPLALQTFEADHCLDIVNEERALNLRRTSNPSAGKMGLARSFSRCLAAMLAVIAVSWAQPGAAEESSSTSPELASALSRIEQLERQVDQLLNARVSESAVSFDRVEHCGDGRSAGRSAGCGSDDPGKSASGGPNLYPVYDGGFVLRPFDADKTPFELKLSSWIQFRHTAFDSAGPTPDQNDFDLERVRLVFSGYALTKDLQYFFQCDGDDNQNQRLDMLDYYLSYDVGHAQLGLDNGELGIRAGRWKVPFNRTRYTSGLNLQFADRSMSSVFFDIDRSVGVGLYGKADAPVAPVNWEFALINGIRTNNARPDRTGDLDGNLAVSGRVFSDVAGEWGSDFESDLKWHESLAVRLGAGFAYSRDDIADGPVEASRHRVVDSGATLTSRLPGGASAYDAALFALSADFRYHGWSLSTEYYFRSLSGFSGVAVPDLFDHGFLVQSGYFLIPQTFEVFSRWSRIVGDSGSLGAASASADEVAGGAAWWIKGRNLKLVFDVTRVNSSPVSDSAVGLQPGDDGLLYRTQFQFLF